MTKAHVERGGGKHAGLLGKALSAAREAHTPAAAVPAALQQQDSAETAGSDQKDFLLQRRIEFSPPRASPFLDYR